MLRASLFIVAAVLMDPFDPRVSASPADEAAIHSTPLALGSPGRVVELTRELTVPRGGVLNLAGPLRVSRGGVLRLEPGTTVRARIGAYIAVSREGTIEADGTLNEPIELTCDTEPRFSGCWGGLIIQGNAQVNAGALSSPAGERGGSGGCAELADPVATSEAYGGCVDTDSSGFVRYVRIQYAERGLVLQGVGSGTRIESVQVNRSRNEGVLVVGGAARLRALFLTANGTGLRWSSGWRGAAQEVVIQQDPASFVAGVVGENAHSPTSSPDAEPRSAPSLANLTLLAQSVPSNPRHTTATALVLGRGTAGRFFNTFLYAPQIALDLRDDATCLQVASGALQLLGVVSAGATALAEGVVPVSCPADESTLLADTLAGNRVLVGVSGLLRSENDLLLPDLRPLVTGALAMTAAVLPPMDAGLQSLAFIGAVRPSALSGDIPWFSGWTAPAPMSAPIPSGTVTGQVRSPFRGAVGGVVVRDVITGLSAVTNAAGDFTLSLPAGTALLDATGLPVACTPRAPVAATVRPLDSTIVTVQVDCWPFPSATRIAAGDGFGCAVAEQGSWCWGRNDRGQLGNGGTADSVLPTQVQASLIGISAGGRHACGVSATAAVRCWGAGDEGQIGDGGGADRATPQVVAGGGFVDVSVGDAHSCALDAAGTAWCWGRNAEGQLGTGSVLGSAIPTAVTAPVAFAAIAAGARHTCALSREGAAYCWGDNAQGQLGVGAGGVYTSPVAVVTAARFGRVATGGAHSCAIDGDGAAWCWGSNTDGQLGDGTLLSRSAPTPVSGVFAWHAIATGAAHTCAVRAVDVVRCWGRNTNGQLGDGTLGARSTPEAVGPSAQMRAVTTGPDFSCGITYGAVTEGRDGGVVVISLRSLLCWGQNAAGQFGSGDRLGSLTPVPSALGLTFQP